MPKCPLCGAYSTWIYFPGMRPELHGTIPDDCHFCKTEEEFHRREWEEGIDVTEFQRGILRWLVSRDKKST